MKKLVSFILALAIIFVMTTPVFAAENTNLTISDSAGKQYAGFQLLTLTTSVKAGDTCVNGEHSESCYNYAYTVNTKYKTYLQEETFQNGGNYLWEQEPKPANATLISETQIMKYLNNQTGANGTMRQVADRLYRKFVENNVAADKTNLTGTENSIGQGYWLFADVTDLSGQPDANSMVIVDTKGKDSLTIAPKTSEPTIEKKVKDIEDTEDDRIADNAWLDSADHDIGDTVPFKLTATLPSNFRAYIVMDEQNTSINPYKLVFHDTLSEGLTLNSQSVVVYMYETKHKADADTDLNDAPKTVTNEFQVKTTGLDDGCSFEIVCEDIIKIDGVTADSAFVVYYEATLNEEAVIGSEGNSNEAYLEFTNNPYGDTTGKTAPDVVTVFTYQLTINKVDAEGQALQGAGFTLYKKKLNSTADDHYELVGELGGRNSTITEFVWKGLDDGDYKLVESVVPEGYNGMSPIEFSISATHSETDNEPKLISLDGGLLGMGVVENSVLTGNIEKDVVNNTGTQLPSTGAMGTMWLILGGTMLVVLASVFMITRKKMSVYED